MAVLLIKEKTVPGEISSPKIFTNLLLSMYAYPECAELSCVYRERIRRKRKWRRIGLPVKQRKLNYLCQGIY